MGHLKVVMDKERSREDRSTTRKGGVFRLAFVVQNDKYTHKHLCSTKTRIHP
jgi:hypothetical protein